MITLYKLFSFFCSNIIIINMLYYNYYLKIGSKLYRYILYTIYRNVFVKIVFKISKFKFI